MNSRGNKILILGATGFIGRNLLEYFEKMKYDIGGTSKGKNGGKSLFFFDLCAEDSWENVLDYKPDIIIDAIGYGVIKQESDLDMMFKINYLLKKKLYQFIRPSMKNLLWVELGTAFEYDIEIYPRINEYTHCHPSTYYGISKLQFSRFLLETNSEHVLLVRPFGIFGKYESSSKIIPALILAQKNKTVIKLSSGTQKRDYIHVSDLCKFIALLISFDSQNLPKVINVGSGQPIMINAFAKELAKTIPDFDSVYWKWGSIPDRSNEGSLFYNASSLANSFGFTQMNLQQALKDTVHYYYIHDK